MCYLNNCGLPTISGYQNFLDYQVALRPEEVVSLALFSVPVICLFASKSTSHPFPALLNITGADSYRLSFPGSSVSWLPAQFC